MSVDPMADLKNRKADEAILPSYPTACARKGISPEEMMKQYRDWIHDEEIPYEMLEMPSPKGQAFASPLVTAKELADSVPVNKRAEYQILDIGAGTGLAAKWLLSLGFKDIDAVDPSEDMLIKARDLGRYRNYFCQRVTGEDKLPFQNDSYDAVVCSGAFIPNHIPCAALNEFIRVVKPGGYIVIVTRLLYVQTGEEYRNLEPMMKDLENARKWKRVVREVFPEYAENFEGIKWKYEVM